MVSWWSLPNHFASQAQSILQWRFFSGRHVWCKWISTRRLADDRMSRGLTNTNLARGFSDLHHVFARKQCILCATLHHKCCLTLLCYIDSRLFSIFSASGTVAHGSIRLSPRSLASSREEKLGLMVDIDVWLSCKRGSKSLIFQTFFILVKDVMWPGHTN